MSMPRQPGADAFDFLSAQLIDAIQAWSVPGPAWDESALDDWARQAFRLQCAGNASYAKYCHARGVGPSDVSGWRDFVPVPTAAFRVVDLIVGRPSDARLIFLTSGTTRGPSARGRHLVRSPELYRASLRAAFRVFVLKGDESAKLIALPPSFTYEAHSSLGWMLDDVRSGIGSGDGVSVARATGIDWEALGLEIRRAADAGRAVCLLGTSLGLAEWLDRMRDGRSAEVTLPAGSVLMDTGGGVLKARPCLEDDQPFILYNVDVYTNLDIRKLYDHHMKNDALVTIAVTGRQTSRSLLFDKDGYLAGWQHNQTGEQRLVRKHPGILHAYANSCVHILDQDFFAYNQLEGIVSLTDIYLGLAAEHKISCFVHNDDFWYNSTGGTMNIGWQEILLILLIVLLLFGARKIPDLAKGLGKGIREFKKGMSEIEKPAEEEEKKTDEKPED